MAALDYTLLWCWSTAAAHRPAHSAEIAARLEPGSCAVEMAAAFASGVGAVCVLQEGCVKACRNPRGDPRGLVGCACKHKCSRAEKHAGIKKWVSFACNCVVLMHEACWRVCLAATKKKGHCPDSCVQA